MNTFKINRSVGNHHQNQQDNNRLIDRNQSTDHNISVTEQQQPQRVSQSGLPPALKTEAPRQTGPESRVTGRETPVPPATARWVPPSLRPQHGLTQEIKNDTIYRKVRGILNKLTPEKFQNLSDELLKIDLNSPIILNGVILLIFEKALDEPKYSSMYAQLCKRLSDEAPNNDPPNGPTTFLRILLNVCRLKFFNRTNDTKTRDNQYITDDEERKLITKQKMLGNVKFIGELSKLDMLSIDTLHTCVFELLNKQTSANANNITSIQEKCEDMECLCQLIRTCGKKLDTEKGKILMDQYFEKMAYRSKSQKYPPRIRFMLRDVIELRRNNWIPRNVTNVEGPMPMDQLIPDDDIVVRPQYMNRNRMDSRNMDHDSSDNWMNKLPLNLQSNYMDVFSGYNISSSSNLMSPYNNNSNNYNNRDHRDGGGMNGGMGGNSGYRMNNQRMNNQNNNYSNHRYNNNNNNNNNNNKQHNNNNNNNNNNSMMMMHNNMNSHNNNNYNNHNNHMSSNSMNNNNNNNNNNNKELAPRFKRNLIQSVTQDPVENLQFRPATNSLLYKPSLNINSQQLPLKQQPRPLNNSTNNELSAMSSSSSMSSPLLPITQTSSTIITSPMLNNNNNNNHNNNNNNNNRQMNNNYNTGGTSTFGGNGNNGNVQQNNMMNNLNKENTMMINNNMKNLSINAGGGVSAQSTVVNASGAGATQSAIVNNLQGGKDQLIIKPGSTENNNINKSKPKKDKGPSKEEILKRIVTFLNANLINDNKKKINDGGEQNNTTTTTTIINNINNNDVMNIIDGSNLIENQEHNMDDIVLSFIELKVPEKFMRDSITAIITEIIDKNELIHERTIEFLICLKRDGKLNSNAFIDGFKVVINSMNEINVPRIATIIASLLSRSVIGKLCKLSDISNYCDNGQHYPLFLLVLQQLHKTFGSKQKLIELFNESKINLMSSLYEADRNKERLAAILDDRNLSFLYPLLKVQGELHKQLQADSNPQQFYKWIKDNVDSSCFTDPGFITALMTVLLKFITQETTLAEGIDLKNMDKELIEREQALLKKYAPVLIVFLKKNFDLQLIAIYALQVFCYNVNFPKGMLLRWFSNLYESNVIEEESFLRWKEDLSDVYMGKGKALFQVNNWLTWLEQAESEDDEEED